MATATQSARCKELDARQQSSASCDFENALRQKIVGQNEAIQVLVDLYQLFCAGLHSPERPVANLLFLGPTGSGKTRIVEDVAEILLGNSRAVIKVACAEFQHSHEIAKLIASPPGYLGHLETHPLITQEALAQYHTEKLKISFLLFDEIGKAGDAVAAPAGNPGQSDTDAGGQPARGFVADDDLHDIEFGRQGNHGADDGRNGICACGRTRSRG